MSVDDPDSRALRDSQRPPALDANEDRTIETTRLDAAPANATRGLVQRAAGESDGPPFTPLVPWTGGRIALTVAGIGLAGAAVGAVWFGVAERLGLNPGGVMGMSLVIAGLTLL